VNWLGSQFVKAANKMPEQIALVFGDHKIEYGRLLEAVKRLAAGLQSLGVQKGDRVALMLPNLPHFCISYYATLYIGAVSVPINIMSSEKQLAWCLQHSNAKVIISWNGFLAQLLSAVQAAPACERILLLGEKIPNNCTSLTQLTSASEPLSSPEEVQPDEPAVIQYTMGSADEELGAVLSHAALLANAATCQEMFRVSAEDRIAGVMPLFHPLGQTLAMNASLLCGATLVLLPRFSAPVVIDAIKKQRITFMPAAPGMFRALLDDQTPAEVDSLKLCLSYGGSLPEELLLAFEKKFNTFILESYGLTEAGPLVSANRLNVDRKIGSVGLPLLGVDVEIRNDQGALLRPNQSGEIWINSPSVMSGYHQQPEQTAVRLKGGWLFSGDMGYLDDDHYLYIQERKDDIILKGGFHIFSFEVEAVIRQHYEVAEVAVVAIPDPIQGAEVKAYVVRKQGGTCGSEELIEYCRNNLPYYKSPRYVEFCDRLPKSPTGRVLKSQLRKQAAIGHKGKESR
jgi:long-chain acyl-CoA synthetase